ncbi:multicystatin-like [Coffea eugenioides]|uniref:multicystatin-like n=1 Tax=Coffea eugenioides TaxID=49369 RepID=UPI000F613AE7|nr:multicystatin-like [Coffea eugenioides]
MAAEYVFHEEGYREYQDEINNSEGFYVMSDYGRILINGIVKVENRNALEKAEDAARFAVKQYNEKENANWEFLKILNLNMEPAAGSMYYITLEAKNTSNNEVNHYQAKVWARINTGFRVEVFRLAPYAAKSSESSRDDRCYIRIENLQSWMDENYLYYKCFYTARELLSIKVIRNEDGNQSEGHGFLQFETPSAAEKFLVFYKEKQMPSSNQSYKLALV